MVYDHFTNGMGIAISNMTWLFRYNNTIGKHIAVHSLNINTCGIPVIRYNKYVNRKNSAVLPYCDIGY